MLDKAQCSGYNKRIFYERTVKTMTITKRYQMPKQNNLNKHGVCRPCTAMC